MPSEFSSSAHSTPLRAWFYFTVNALYAAAFAIFVFAVWQDPCYTKPGINAPVAKGTEGSVNTTANWNMIMFAAFVVYALAACASVSQCFSGVWGRRLQTIDKYCEYMCILMFIALHITRWTHSGAVCAGDYLTEAELEAGNNDGYLLGTGTFLTCFIIVGWVIYPAFLIATLLVYGPKGQVPAIMLDSPK